METIVITRHKSLIQYLKEIELVTGNEPIISGNATLDDVRGKHIIGVLPNFLSAQAACLTEVPLKVPQEFRGQELSLEQIREFAQEPVTYRVAVIPTPKPDVAVRWTWNNGQGSRGRQARCFVIAPDGNVYRFTGQDIPGIVKVLGRDYEKRGKWSNSTYRCISPAGVVSVSWMQDWDTGATFPQDTWEEAFEWLATQAPQANFESFESLVRQEFSETATKFDENKKAMLEFCNEGRDD